MDWEALVGTCVVAEGYLTSGAKTGPTLLGGGYAIAVVPKGTQGVPNGARVRVRGVVAVRTNSAVFAQRPGEPVQQGIPAPEGMALEAARRQTVIEQALVTAIRSRAEVERELADAVGKDVSLPGVVWGLGGHYWFNHDGVELHVEGQHPLPEWSSLHGKVVTLRGRLTRRPMPRISQLALESKPELADAFVLGLTGAAEPSESNVMP